MARRLLLAAVFCLAAVALADLGVCPVGSTVAQDVAPCAGLDGPGHGPDQHWHDGRGVSAALTESPWRSQLPHRGLNTAAGLDEDLAAGSRPAAAWRRTPRVLLHQNRTPLLI